jgi:hypothetical protein
MGTGLGRCDRILVAALVHRRLVKLNRAYLAAKISVYG